MTFTRTAMPAGDAESPRVTRSVSFVRFTLRLTEPGGVTVPAAPSRDDGAPWGRERAHLLLDLDPWGRPHFPGTSLAGALREMVHGSDGEATADAWFGQLLAPGSGGTEVDARASLIWVLGSRPVDAAGNDLDGVTSEIRASTAISRSRAAAEANTLRVAEMLPAGSRLEVFLRWDDPPQGDLNRFLALLSRWRPLLGHGTSRGQGRCVIESIHHGQIQLDDPAGLHQWLTQSGVALARDVARTEIRPSAAAVKPLLEVAAEIVGPLRVGSGEPPQATGAQGQQVTPMFRVGADYVLPGAGLKGLLRSRAEYILRSVRLHPEPCPNQRCGRCWTCAVFGFGGGNEATAEAVGKRALIRAGDAMVLDPVPVQRQHVAIDRFTGGAADGLLYTVDALEGGTFQLSIETFADPPDENLLAQIRAVLRLVLEDIDDGIVGIGAGVARGYGSVRVDLAAAQERGDLPSGPAAREELQRMVAASTPLEDL
jgi:CRISPR/Cas system CSM-associated protein Csm3 (group 7 of RAMP superfamily)